MEGVAFEAKHGPRQLLKFTPPQAPIPQVEAAASYLGSGQLPGFDTLVIDGGWYSCGPGSSSFDGNGLPTPCPDKYGGRTLAQIAASVRQAGVRGFGVWTIRGIPREAVEKNLPIAGSSFTAMQAARLDRNCSWDSVNYGVKANAAGRAWYDSLFNMLAASNVSFVKMDCLFPSSSNGPFNEPEVAMFAEAMQQGTARTGHHLTVSFSPGVTVSTANASQIAANGWATQYRVTQDFWDVWKRSGSGDYPTDLYSKVDVAARFSQYFGLNGTFADLDMLPIGRLGAHAKASGGISPVTGPPTPTQFTEDEQRFLASLWIITRAPLMLGAFIPLDPKSYPADAVVHELLTNAKAIQISRCSHDAQPVHTKSSNETTAAWASVPTNCTDQAAGDERNVALFNRADASQDVSVAMTELHLQGQGCWCANDVWAGTPLQSQPLTETSSLVARLAPHAAALLHLAPAASCTSSCQ